MQPDLPDPLFPSPGEVPPPPVRPPRRWAWLLGAGVLGVAGLLGGGAAWVWGTEAGTRQLLAQVPGLTVQGLRGAPGQGGVAADQLRWQGSAGELRIQGLQLQGLRYRWRPAPGIWLGLAAESLRATEVRWATAADAPAAAPLQAPVDLRLPVTVDLQMAEVQHLQIDQQPLLQALKLSGLSLGTDRHVLQGFSGQTDRLRWQAEGQIGARAPLPVTAQVQVRSLADGHASQGAVPPPATLPPWLARLTLQGPLAQLDLAVDLQAEGTGPTPAQATAPAPSLQGRLALRPFAAWPLGDVQLRTQDLDLSALHAAWPRTRWRGQMDLRTAGLDQPARATLNLRNEAPGAFDAGQLPLRALDLVVVGTPSPLRELRLERLQADLGDAQGTAGRIEGEGQWLAAAGEAGQQAQLQLALTGLAPARWSRQAPAARVDGSLRLQALASAGQALDLDHTRLNASGHLSGQLQGTKPQPVTVDLDLGWADQRLRLSQFDARAGAALASLKGELSRNGSAAAPVWRWALQGQLAQFDPAAWWPALGNPAGPHRLQGQWQSQGQAPQGALASPWSRMADIQGSARADWAGSQWAGTPLAGHLDWQSQGAQVRADAEVLLAGRNALRLQWQPDGGSLTLDAPELAALAPWWPRGTPDAPWSALPRQGKASAQLSWRGALAQAALQLRAQADGWQAPALRLQHADLEAQLVLHQMRPDPGQAWQATLRLTDLRQDTGTAGTDTARVDQALLQLRGSPAAPRLNLQLASPARPPAWLAQWLGAELGHGSQLQATAEGEWRALGAAANPWPAGDWAWRVSELQGRAQGGRGEPWLNLGGLQLSTRWTPETGLQALDAQPGRLTLAGLVLSWDQLRYQAPAVPGGLPRLQVDARVESFAAAPLLARAQPELGWRGDLRLGGRVQVRSDSRLDADLVFERQGGDLSVADDVRDSRSRQQALGLSDLRLGLSAHDGVWYFTQALAGRRVGELAGAATVRTRADALWPDADAPLQGVWQVRVAQLGAWGAWLPPGWRLGGSLQSSAFVNGRFGAPAFTGELQARDLELRNALEGIAWDQGEVALKLEGERASVQTFRFRGGEGQVRLSGEARLGAQPQARLEGVLDRFLVLGRIDRRLVASGDAQLQLDPLNLSLQAKLRVDEGVIDFSRGGAPSLDDDITVVRADAPRDAAGTAAEPDAKRRTQRLQVSLNLGERLRLKGRGLDTGLRGELQVANAANGRLAVTGTVRTEQGTYAAYGQRLSIERGQLSFTGPIEDPRLDILAVRPNLDVVVGVTVSGSALNPRVRLTSEPEMSDLDKLSWLVMGRASDGLGSTDTALLQRAAVALLAGEGEAPTDAFLRNIGLTDFGVRQDETGDTRNTVVSLGRQLSRRWYLGYERSVNATTGTWQLIYRVAQRFTLRAQSGEDNALDLIWTWRWD